MKLAAPVYAAVKLAEEQRLPTGKTVLQKLIFFALPQANREEYYEPYYYGPYSKTVQIIAEQLREKEFLRYNSERTSFEIAKRIELKKLQNSSLMIDRLREVISFLKEKALTSTGQIALLSKVFLFDNGDAINSSLIQKIKDKSCLFNWTEVTSAREDTLDKQVRLARELKTRLESLPT